MSWVDKELSLAALTGAVTGVAVTIPIVGDGAWSWVGLFIPAFIGALAGLIVGSSAVAGGRCALRTSHTWPAHSLLLEASVRCVLCLGGDIAGNRSVHVGCRRYW